MSSRCLKLTIILLATLCLGLAGCAQKIVKPRPPYPGPPGPYVGGPVGEQEIQAVQAGLKPVYFDYDRYTLSPQAQADLQYNAEVLRRAPYIAIVAEGHCDERGTAEYNLALGDRRAQAVKKFLESLGIPADKLQILSKGSLGATEKGTEEQMSKDRRVEFVVLKK